MPTTVLILGPWDYFPQPSGQPASVHSRTEAQIWSGLESVHSAVHAIFNSLFRLVVHSDVQYSTVQYSTVQYSTNKCCANKCCAINDESFELRSMLSLAYWIK